MKVLVTGGTGFIGSHLVKTLVEKGHSVLAGTRDVEGVPDRIPSEVEMVELDVTRPETLVFEGVDAVIHLVALSPLFKPKNLSHEKVTVEGTENMLRAAEEAGVKHFIYMSALGADTGASTEYLRTKGRAEELVESSDLAHTVLRPSIVFGEGDEFINGLENLARLPLVPLPGGGRNTFQPIHVGDVADIFAQLVDSGSEEVLEIGGPEILSMKQIVEGIGETKGRKPFVLPIPMPLVYLGLTVFDRLPLVPFGLDQYRSLKLENVVEENDAERFVEEFRTLDDYLEVYL